MDIPNLLAAAASVVQLVRNVRELLPSDASAELRQAVLELQERALDAREAQVASREELAAVRAEIAQLRQGVAMEPRVIREEEVVRLRDPKPHEPQGNCCVACWDEDRRIAAEYFKSRVCARHYASITKR